MKQLNGTAKSRTATARCISEKIALGVPGDELAEHNEPLLRHLLSARGPESQALAVDAEPRARAGDGDTMPHNGRRGQKRLIDIIRYVVYMVGSIHLFVKYKTRTMVGWRRYIENLAIARIVLANTDLARGAIIECGTWKGGMAAGLVEIGGRKRHYYFFDSFEGLPPVQEIDGQAAKQWQADTSSLAYCANCAASVEDFSRTLGMTGCPTGNIHTYKGFFEDTLPTFEPPPIAILRLDADWYASTMICLERLWDHILPGGLILIDDYHSWDGCSKAIHAFLAAREAPERIHQGPVGRTAFILKRPS